MRNILANAAHSGLVDDDVVRMFLQWVATYSELDFAAIGAVYNDKGVTRARMWEKWANRKSAKILQKQTFLNF